MGEHCECVPRLEAEVKRLRVERDNARDLIRRIAVEMARIQGIARKRSYWTTSRKFDALLMEANAALTGGREK